MANFNHSRTPVDTESKLGPEGVPVLDPTYRCLAGGLQYLTFNRPDISFTSGCYVFLGWGAVTCGTSGAMSLRKQVRLTWDWRGLIKWLVPGKENDVLLRLNGYGKFVCQGDRE